MGCRGRNSCQPVVTATVCTAATVGPVRQSRGKGARKREREKKSQHERDCGSTARLDVLRMQMVQNYQLLEGYRLINNIAIGHNQNTQATHKGRSVR